MPTAGDMVPGGPSAQARKVAALEREVRELRAARRLESASVTNGRFRVLQPDGTTVVGVGQWSDGEYGTELRRDDGSMAVSVSGQGPDAHDMVRVWSRSGASVLVMDDAFADDYLGRPWVPVPMNAGIAFTGTSWATTHSGVWWRQHAVLDFAISVAAPASTTAQMRIMAWLGGTLTQLGSTITATGAEQFGYFRATRAALEPARYADQISILAQVQRTAGTGTCSAWCHGVWGSNTYDATEA